MNPRLLVVSFAASVLGVSIPAAVAGPGSARDLTFEEHVACRTAIERVNYGHRLGATRPFEAAVPRQVIEQKVRRFFRDSAALERDRPDLVTAESLARELQRMGKETRMPERLLELYAALGNDPVLVQECLVRPALVSRLVASQSGADEGRLMTPNLDESSQLALRDEQPVAAVASAAVVLPAPGGDLSVGSRASPAPCPDNVWSNGALGSHPDPGWDAEAVWTGSEMIYWSGISGGLFGAGTGSRYDPGTDTWSPMSAAGAPEGRTLASVVWTGTRMIVWGGYGNAGPLATGGLYDPVTDTWSALTTNGAPSPRYRHVAVWTGSVMLVWGGTGTSLTPTGARYDPATDSWSPISAVGAPMVLTEAVGVWTGNLLVVWGGWSSPGTPDVPYGGRYDPATDTWSPMSTLNEPGHRGAPTIVWTGQEVIVWGGTNIGHSEMTNTGGRYNPLTNTWTGIPGGPEARAGHSAVWTGSRMVVWGGRAGNPSLAYLNSGGIYDPSNGSWISTGALAAPAGRSEHAAVWTGSRMIVFGGQSDNQGFGDGAQFDLASNSWTPMAVSRAPQGYGRKGVWTGTEMVVWGLSNGGGRYDPALNTWFQMSTVNAPVGLDGHAMVWTGQVVVVWGGRVNDTLSGAINTGGRYNPVTDTWQSTATAGAPSARLNHTAVWAGQQMIVWGGTNHFSSGFATFKNGGRYDPVNNTWSPMSTAGPQVYRHAAIWTGSQMIVWKALAGSRYDPGSDTWSAVAPGPCCVGPHGLANLGDESVVWTGSRMIVWGGTGSLGSSYVTDGGAQYDPVTNGWQAMSLAGAPAGRYEHTAVWTGSHMIVWGGHSNGGELYGDGARFDPVLNRWTPLASQNAPNARYLHVGVWDGSGMMIYDGQLPNNLHWNKGCLLYTSPSPRDS